MLQCSSLYHPERYLKEKVVNTRYCNRYHEFENRNQNRIKNRIKMKNGKAQFWRWNGKDQIKDASGKQKRHVVRLKKGNHLNGKWKCFNRKLLRFMLSSLEVEYSCIFFTLKAHQERQWLWASGRQQNLIELVHCNTVYFSLFIKTTAKQGRGVEFAWIKKQGK